MPEKNIRLEDLLPGGERDPKSISITGAPSIRETREVQEEAERIPFSTHVVGSMFALRDNAAGTIARAFTEDDPNYVQHENVDYYMQGLSEVHRESFVGTLGPRSHTEATMIRESIVEDEDRIRNAANAGFKGISGLMLGAVLDPVQLPLMLLSNGTFAGTKVAGALEAASIGQRTKSALSVGAAGAEAGLYTGVLEAGFIPTSTGADIPVAILGGMGIGGVLGGTTKVDFTMHDKIKHVKSEASEMGARVDEGFTPGDNDRAAPVTPAPAPEIDEAGSVGAAAVKGPEIAPRKDPLDDVLQGPQRKNYKEALRKKDELGITAVEVFDDTPNGRAASAFNDAINKTGVLKNDFDRLSSYGPSGQVLAYQTMESALGKFRNNRSAAAYSMMYEADMMAPVIRDGNWRRLRNAWITDRGVTKMEQHITQATQLEHAFGRELALARNHLRMHGKHQDSVHPAIRELSDAHDEMYSAGVRIAQGADDEISVKGFETLAPEIGFQPQKWIPDMFRRTIDEADSPKVMRTNLEESLYNSYKRLYTGIDDDLLRIYANRLVTRQNAKARSLDMNLFRMLDQNGAEYLRLALVDNGLSATHAGRLVDQLAGMTPDTGKISHGRSRMDVDLSTPVKGTDKQLVDFIETHPYKVPAKYAKQIGGAAGLARHDIHFDTLDDILQQVKDEAIAAGKPFTKDDELLVEGFRSYFSPAPIAGGVSPFVARAVRLTNLALLNQLGLTQLAETGIIIGASGYENFAKSIREVLSARTNPETLSIAKQFEDIGLLIGQNHHLIDSEFAIDWVRESESVRRSLGDWLDIALAKGQRVQGYTSGFYAMMAKQQELAVGAISFKMQDIMSKGTITSADDLRLRDMGLEGKTLNRIERYFTDGTVTLKDGTIDFGFDKWNTRDLDDFKLAMYRFSDQMLQRARPGEDSILWHTDTGKLFTHLRTFTLTSMTKSFARNMRFMDDATRATFLYGLATAGASYSAKQIINGRTDRLEPMEIAQGAFGLSNMTGWIPMFYDPAMSMLGLEDARITNYGRGNISTGVLPMPVALPTLNRMAHIPGDAIPSVLSGDYTNQDVYALRTTPLIGNAYGFTLMFNDMKK